MVMSLLLRLPSNYQLKDRRSPLSLSLDIYCQFLCKFALCSLSSSLPDPNSGTIASRLVLGKCLANDRFVCGIRSLRHKNINPGINLTFSGMKRKNCNAYHPPDCVSKYESQQGFHFGLSNRYLFPFQVQSGIDFDREYVLRWVQHRTITRWTSISESYPVFNQQ